MQKHNVFLVVYFSNFSQIMDRSILFDDINERRNNKNVIDDKKVKKATKSKKTPTSQSHVTGTHDE